MTIVGFNFMKMNIERNAAPTGKIDIKNNVAIVSAKRTEFHLGKSKDKGITFGFEFVSKYEPKIGEIRFSGDILYIGEDKKNEQVMTEWEKNKKVPNEVMNELLKTILGRCNVEAVLLSRDINLPPPIPFNIPKLQ